MEILDEEEKIYELIYRYLFQANTPDPKGLIHNFFLILRIHVDKAQHV